MYERFTDRSRKVMQLAQQEAQRFNHEYIGTEHILLGLVKEGSGVAANVLKNLDIDLRKIRLEVEKIVQTGPDMVTMGKLPQTPSAKKVIEYSIEEARNLNHNYVGTEHLLLGLLRQQEGVAAQVLMNLGLKLEGLREEVLKILSPPSDKSPDPDESALSRFANHPLIRALSLQIEQLTLEKEAAIAEQDFEKAAHLRDQEDKLKGRRATSLRRLRENPRYGRLLEHDLAKYCRPLDWPPPDSFVRPEAETCVSHLLAGRVVLLVGPIGCGRKTLAQQIGQRLAMDDDNGLPPQLLTPNFLALDDAGAELTEVLLELLEKLGDSRSYLLAVPELHTCADCEICDSSSVNAWKMAIGVVLERKRALLAWTTPAGRDHLAAAWPGAFAAFEVIPVPVLEDRVVEVILARKLDAIGRARKLEFEDGFAQALIEASRNWPEQNLVNPALSLELLQLVLDFDKKRKPLSPAVPPRAIASIFPGNHPRPSPGSHYPSQPSVA